MLVRRTTPVPFECVVRGYLSGSAWKEYAERGTLAGEPLPPGLVESARLEPPVFSPATKEATGHDVNVPFGAWWPALGAPLAERLRDASFAVYGAGRDHAATRGIIIADTKFEFGLDPQGTLRLIDEVLTPDSSRFWPADQYHPGRSQPSFDKQPLRDWLLGLKADGAVERRGAPAHPARPRSFGPRAAATSRRSAGSPASTSRRMPDAYRARGLALHPGRLGPRSRRCASLAPPWAALLWLPVAVWVIAFFRDPVREGPRGDKLVIAPADGWWSAS